MRLYQIMNDLLHTKGYSTVDSLSACYHISKRTVHNDISELMRSGSQNGYSLQNKRGQGYFLEVLDQAKVNKFIKSLDNDEVSSPEDRPRDILNLLALNRGYVTMDAVAEQLRISKAQLRNNMDQAETEANHYGFSIERESHYGIRLKSDSVKRRNYLVQQYLNENETVKRAIDKACGDVTDLSIQIATYFNKENLNINYNELITILVYVRVIVLDSLETNSTRHQTAYDVTDSIDRITMFTESLMEKNYNIAFSETDHEELLQTFRINVRKEPGRPRSVIHLTEDINEFLEENDQKFGTNYSKDEEFKRMLITHVTFLLDRLHRKISYKNPLVTELNITNPVVFNNAIMFCNMIHEKYGVVPTVDEVGFIAMHFAAHLERERQNKLYEYSRIAVVCSSGGGSAYMLKMQLESLFNKADVETFSFLQEQELNEFQPDLIFTVIPLHHAPEVPIIYIKELLDDADLFKIRQILEYQDNDPYALMNVNPIFYALLKSEYWQIVEDDDYRHLIGSMADRLERDGYGQPGYKELVLQRESYVSTVYLNGVCIPHSIETNALKDVIYINVLKKPFTWNKKQVKIVFMISLQKQHVDIYKKITKRLYTLMKSAKSVETLVHAKSFNEMVTDMKEMEGIEEDE